MSVAERPQPSSMTTILSIMMFLQFFTWGAWFATLGLAMTENKLSSFVGRAYEAAPIAAIIAPLFLGLIADRFFASEKVMGVLMLIGGAILLAIPSVAENNGDLLVWMILAHMLCYMPTLGLSNTIAFSHIPSQDKFPMIRVWGTIGWIAAGLLIGGTGWDKTFIIFRLGAISAVLLGIFCFFLPHTPPPLKGKPMDVRSLFMLDAFALLKSWNFLVFAVCSTLICIPLAYYYGSTSQFLGQTGFTAPGATMTLGQMSEIIFMVLIPFFFRRLGVKMMILIGMACWVLRYVLFAYGAPDQVAWMLLLAVALHGICYDFFFVTGFMYTDQKASKEIRGQAQGLLVFLTQGVGMFFGYRIMAAGNLFGFIPLDFTIGKYGEQVTNSEAYAAALGEARGETEQLGFFETFLGMFSRELPSGLNPELLSATMEQWKNFWMFPAIMAAGVLVLFFVAFWDRTVTASPEETNPEE
jgi:nucleoside transporter